MSKAHRITATLTGFESFLLSQMAIHYTKEVQTMADEPRSIMTKAYVNSCISELCSKLKIDDPTPKPQTTETEVVR